MYWSCSFSFDKPVSVLQAARSLGYCMSITTAMYNSHSLLNYIQDPSSQISVMPKVEDVFGQWKTL